MKKRALVIVVILAVAAGGYWFWHSRQQPSKASSSTTTKTTSPTTSPAATAAPSFNKQQYSTSESSSLWVVVNKQRPLSPGYIPANLVTPDVPLRLSAGNEEMKMRSDAAAALKTMFAAAKADGVNLLIASGYRSESFQRSLHAAYVSQQGQTAADNSSARAGYSEHQTGLAVDVGRTDHKCEVEDCFADTTEGKWVAQNSYKYGFFVRYPQGKQNITGYIYEPWHIRYVGNELAAAIQQSGQTMEEFFGLPAAPDYAN